MKKRSNATRELEYKIDDVVVTRSNAHYNRCFNSDVYKAAIGGKSVAYANRLLDYAQAICGNPYFKFRVGLRLSPAAIAFLQLFLLGDDNEK